MKWETVKLADITEYITDGDHQPAPKTNNGIHFIKIQDIIGNTISFEANIFVPIEYYNNLPNNRKPLLGDTLYTVVGSYGIPAFVRTSEKFCFERNIALLHPNKAILPRFLYYCLKNPSFFKKIETIANGSAQKLIPLSKLSVIEIQIPTIQKQETIIDWLSPYDDLIENNQKQIKLLEEMVQRLYKEWFIDLRFPGHENTPIHNGLPEGWEIGTLEQLAMFKRGQTITKDQVHNGTIPVVAGGLEPAYYHNIANTKAPVITVSGSGANAGYTRMYHVDVFASDCSFADTNSTSFLAYAYCFLIEKKNDLRHMQKGSAQPHVYAKDINALPILIPEVHVLKKFCDIVAKMLDKIGILEKQNTLSTQAREHLLPRLMKGEIEVK